MLFYDRFVGCRVKAYCPFVGSDPVGRVPSVGCFLRDNSQYIREFRYSTNLSGTINVKLIIFSEKCTIRHFIILLKFRNHKNSKTKLKAHLNSPIACK